MLCYIVPILTENRKGTMMEGQYSLVNGVDLTFDDVDMPKNEKISEISEKLRPTQAMQDRFMKNCVDMGILTTI